MRNSKNSVQSSSILEAVFVGLILLMVFRYPVFAPFTSWREFIWLYPLPLAFIFVFRWRWSDLVQSPVLRVLLVWGALAMVGSALNAKFGAFSPMYLVRGVGSTAYMFLFLALLAGSRLGSDPRSFFKVLGWIARAYLFFGGFLVIGEYVVLSVLRSMTAHELHEWFYRGNPVPPLALRRVGFLITKEYGVLGVLASWSYLLVEALKENGRWTRRVLIWTGVAGATTLLSDSITSYLIFALLLGLYLILFPKIWERVSGWMLLCLFIFFLLGLKWLDTGTRISAYALGKIAMEESFMPRLQGCDAWFFLLPPNHHVESCNAKEFHGFHALFRYGIFVMAGWYFALLAPWVVAIREIIKGRIPGKSTMMAFTFSLGILHYAGAEAWGNNFVFLLAVLGGWLFETNSREYTGT